MEFKLIEIRLSTEEKQTILLTERLTTELPIQFI